MRRALGAAGLGLALCLTAASFAAAPLYLPGVALILVAAAAVGWVSLAARGAALLRSPSTTAVEEHAALPLTVRVRRSRLPLPGAELRAWPGGPALASPHSRDATVIAAASFPRRGRHRLEPASLLISDPLGLCARSVSSTADEVLVLPRVEPVLLEELGGESAILGRPGRDAGGAATEFDSLRPYRPETPASRIHWSTLARTMALMERHLLDDADQRPVVVVDPQEPTSTEDLDRAVRAASSLSVHLARHGGCALLLPGDRRPIPLDPELRGWPEAHARLALLEPRAGAPALAALTRADTVLWVTATDRPSAGLARLRVPVHYLVSPHPEAHRPIVFSVAGCSGQRVERAGRAASAA